MSFVYFIPSENPYELDGASQKSVFQWQSNQLFEFYCKTVAKNICDHFASFDIFFVFFLERKKHVPNIVAVSLESAFYMV